MWYPLSSVLVSWELLLASSPSLSSQQTYLYDLVDVTRQVTSTETYTTNSPTSILENMGQAAVADIMQEEVRGCRHCASRKQCSVVVANIVRAESSGGRHSASRKKWLQKSLVTDIVHASRLQLLLT